MRKVGYWGYNNKDSNYYIKETDENKVFYLDEECTEVADSDDLNNWAVVINSPWSQKHLSYKIELNCESAYEEMDENEPKWRCIYSITGYDMIEAEVIGYGNTEEEALKDCKELFEYIQKTFNPDDGSF